MQRFTKCYFRITRHETTLSKPASVTARPARVEEIITTNRGGFSRIGRALLPEFTYRQGWWLLGAGIAALVGGRFPSGLLALAFFLVGMVLLLIASATFLRIENEERSESDV